MNYKIGIANKYCQLSPASWALPALLVLSSISIAYSPANTILFKNTSSIYSLHILTNSSTVNFQRKVAFLSIVWKCLSLHHLSFKEPFSVRLTQIWHIWNSDGFKNPSFLYILLLVWSIWIPEFFFKFWWLFPKLWLIKIWGYIQQKLIFGWKSNFDTNYIQKPT